MNIKQRYLLAIVSFILIVTTCIIITVSFATKEDDGDFFYMKDFDIPDDQRLFVYEKMIEEHRKRAREVPQRPSRFYQKRPETQHVDCGRVLSSDKIYIRPLTASRIPLIEDPHLDMSCEALKSRIFPEHLKLKLRPLSAGVAFARIVYRDYEFIERQVQVSYHPQNLFCFAVDKKAPIAFQQKIGKLEECFDNVIVLPATHSYDSSGHNTNLAHYQCMEAALDYPDWSYFVTQENHDVVVKTVYELDKIYELLGGANDIGIEPQFESRVMEHFRFDPKYLKLFRNESGIDAKILETPMRTTKSYKQGSLSRKAVEWMVNTVDVSKFIDQWNETGYAGDEQWFSTLQSNPQIGMPGHFLPDCLDKKIEIDQVTRMSKWHKNVPEECGTRTFRHSICILGIEDLPSVARMPVVMFNKMIPSFDYSIIECTAELLYNRTFLGQVDQKLDEEYYKNMVNVLYHKNHLDPNYHLNCTPSYTPWEYKKLYL